MPYPIGSNREPPLLRQLNSRQSDTTHVRILLSLANMYATRPLKKTGDLESSIRYAEQAILLSRQLLRPDIYNEALLLKGYAMIQQGNYESAEKIIPLLNDSTKVRLLLTLSYKYLTRSGGNEVQNREKAAAFISDALAQKTTAGQFMIPIRQIQGNLLLAEGKYDEAENAFNEVISGLRAAGSNRLQYVLLNLSDLYWVKGDYNRSFAYALQALDHVKQTGDSAAAGDAHFLLAGLFRNTGQLQQSMENYRQALEYYRIYAGTQGSLLLCIQGLGHIMVGQHRYKEALKFFLGEYRKYPPQNYTEQKIVIGDIGDCYLKLKDYVTAEKYFLQEFDAAKKADALNEEAYHRMAFFYVESGNYSKALPYLENAVKQLSGTISIQAKGHLYYMHYLADSAMGNYRSAMQYLRANKQCDDTIYQQTKVREIQHLTVQYETDKKNQQIDLLRKSDQVHQEQREKAELMRNVSIGAVLILIIAGLVFYRQYRNKIRLAAIIDQKNKQLEILLSEKEWLLKEVHHRVKNNLHTVISLLDIQAEFLQDDALKAIENSQHRIYAMSLIHQKLYSEEHPNVIDLSTYVPELVGYLRDSFDKDLQIIYQLNIEPLMIDISVAIPLGLIINEAVSNSNKYAFCKMADNYSDSNIIDICIRKSNGDVLVSISDNGVGMMEDNGIQPADSLGLKLIRGLCRDLNARLTFKNDKGLHIFIRIPVSEPVIDSH